MSVQEIISQKLGSALKPIHLEVTNESHMHSVPPNSETHFKVLIVSSQFEGLSRVARQQRLYQILEDELKQGVHALTQRCLTPSEWQPESAVFESKFESPQCQSATKKNL